MLLNTGIGIPKAKQETVFEQFERLNELVSWYGTLCYSYF